MLTPNWMEKKLIHTFPKIFVRLIFELGTSLTFPASLTSTSTFPLTLRISFKSYRKIPFGRFLLAVIMLKLRKHFSSQANYLMKDVLTIQLSFLMPNLHGATAIRLPRKIKWHEKKNRGGLDKVTTWCNNATSLQNLDTMIEIPTEKKIWFHIDFKCFYFKSGGWCLWSHVF